MSLVLRPSSLAVGALIVVGGLTGASPAICPLPSSFVLRPLSFVPDPSSPHPSSFVLRPSSFVVSPSSFVPGQSREDVDASIDALGAFDAGARIDAARAVRRAPGTVALPALLDAAAGHADGFVRYRALVLLSGYDDPRVPDQMELAIAEVNDRLRAVGFAYFERHPDPRLTPALLKALDKEANELARPALLGALAAVAGRDKRVQAALVKDVARGPELFRGAAIEALGDHKAVYALKAIAAELDGPRAAEAAIAVAKIGDASLLAGLQALRQSAPPAVQPAVATALCLLGSRCDAERDLLARALASIERTPGYQDRLRAAALGLSEMAVAGDVQAGRALFDLGVPAVDPVRAHVAHALAVYAIRQPAATITLLAERADRDQALNLLRLGVDRVADDVRAEGLFVSLRAAYFAEPEGSPRRPVVQAAINALEF